MPTDEQDATKKPGVDSTLIEHIKQQDAKINDLTQRLTEVVEFNNKLLNSDNSPAPVVNADTRHKELQEKLLGGLK